MKTSSIILFLSIMTIWSATAQSNLIGLNIKVYDPMSDFDKNLDNSLPIGLSFNYLRKPLDSRFSFGGELGVAMYSSNDYTLDHNGQDIRVNEEDCFWTIHGIVRYDIYSTERLLTYVEGRIGLTTFFSSTTSLEANSEVDDFSFHGTAFNTGIGGGLMYKIGRLWINAGANIHSGSKSTYRYMPESNQSTSFENGQYSSLTHYMGYRLGVLFEL